MFRFALGFMLGFYVATLAAEKILSTTGGVPSIDHLVQMALTALHLQ